MNVLPHEICDYIISFLYYHKLSILQIRIVCQAFNDLTKKYFDKLIQQYTFLKSIQQPVFYNNKIITVFEHHIIKINSHHNKYSPKYWMSILFKKPWNIPIIININLFMIIKKNIELLLGLYIDKKWITNIEHHTIKFNRYYITTNPTFFPLFQKYISCII